MELKIGGKYTTFEISEFMAHTIQRQIVIKDQIDGKYTFSEKGKRKQYYLKVEKDIAFFEGHELPFMADSETGSFVGHARINLIGDAATIKDYFDNKQLNLAFDSKEKVIAIKRSDSKEAYYPDNQKETIVYPEVV